ncbi:MAG: hypothetical protein IIB67_07605 [Proteobacteria bacterium]|nr:hypothetical protein [Pseudomonadota bacterium]
MLDGERRAEDEALEPGEDTPRLANAIDAPLDLSFATTSVLLDITAA